MIILKVLMLNGSPHPNGSTAKALTEMEKVFTENNIEVETILVGKEAVEEGLIDAVGGIDQAFLKLHSMIDEKKMKNERIKWKSK